MHLFEPIQDEGKLEAAIFNASKLPTANGSMIEAFAKALEVKKLQSEPMDGNLRKAFC